MASAARSTTTTTAQSVGQQMKAQAAGKTTTVKVTYNGKVHTFTVIAKNARGEYVDISQADLSAQVTKMQKAAGILLGSHLDQGQSSPRINPDRIDYIDKDGVHFKTDESEAASTQDHSTRELHYHEVQTLRNIEEGPAAESNGLSKDQRNVVAFDQKMSHYNAGDSGAPTRASILEEAKNLPMALREPVETILSDSTQNPDSKPELTGAFCKPIAETFQIANAWASRNDSATHAWQVLAGLIEEAAAPQIAQHASEAVEYTLVRDAGTLSPETSSVTYSLVRDNSGEEDYFSASPEVRTFPTPSHMMGLPSTIYPDFPSGLTDSATSTELSPQRPSHTNALLPSEMTDSVWQESELDEDELEASNSSIVAPPASIPFPNIKYDQIKEMTVNQVLEVYKGYPDALADLKAKVRAHQKLEEADEINGERKVVNLIRIYKDVKYNELQPASNPFHKIIQDAIIDDDQGSKLNSLNHSLNVWEIYIKVTE